MDDISGGRVPLAEEMVRLVESAFSSLAPSCFLASTASEGVERLAREDAILTFRREDGLVLSAISNRPFLRDLTIRMMPLSGKRVFEIGSGTGYLACILANLCGSTGLVEGCEIIPQLWEASQRNASIESKENVSLRLGDFVEVLPTRGLFDVVLATSSFSTLHASIINACSPEGGLIVLPVEIPGGGDCMTIFQRCGSKLLVKHAMMSVSVPTTGCYSNREIWAPPVGSILPNWSMAKQIVVSLPRNRAHSIHETLAFRSFLFFSEQLYQAVSLGKGALSRASEMAFGLVCTATHSCCLQQGTSLILQGSRALELARRFVGLQELWESSHRPSLATYRYIINVAQPSDFAFLPALSTRTEPYTIHECQI